MSKYEKHAWAMGVYLSLSGGSLFVFDYTPLWIICFVLGCALLTILFPGHRSFRDMTEMETRCSLQATVWTFYATATIVWILIVFVLPQNISLPKNDVIVNSFVHVGLLFFGVRFTVLACLLRKERLSRAAGYRPHPNPLPEGEGKDDHIT